MSDENLIEKKLRLVAGNMAYLFRSLAVGMDRVAKLKKPKSNITQPFARVLFYRIIYLFDKAYNTLLSLYENSDLFNCDLEEYSESGVYTETLVYDREFFKGTSYKMSGDTIRLKYKYKVTHFKSKTEKQFVPELEAWDGYGVVIDTQKCKSQLPHSSLHYSYADCNMYVEVRPLNGDQNARFIFPSYALVIVRNTPSAHTIMRGAIIRERLSNKRGYGKEKSKTKVQGT